MNKKLYKETFSQVTSACQNKMEVIMSYETKSKKHRINKKLAVVAIAIAITIALSLSVYALVKLLTPAEIAREMGRDNLAAAFENGNGTYIGKSVTSDGYTFTLQGLALGSGLDEYKNYTDIDAEQSYFVFSIQNNDGTAFDLTNDFGHFTSGVFFKGYRPWMFSSFMLGAGSQGFEKDGVLYMLLHCDENIEMLADSEVYFAIWDSSEIGFAPSSNLLTIHEDGSITFADNISTAHAMFTLPLDPNKANPDLVNQKLNENGILKEDAKIN